MPAPGTRPFGRLDSRRAFISGGAKGIGAAIVRSFAEAGAHVVIADLDIETASSLAGQIGATAVRLDVGDAGMVQAIMSQHGPFDIVVNNAGVDQHAFFTDTTPEDWARLLAVNLVSAFACTHAALPAMQVAGFGRIINITSEAARLGSKGGAVYSAAKGGVIAFTKSIARENARFGITANSIAPGPIRTPMLEAAVAKGGDKILCAMTDATLLRRLGEPEEIAAAALFLASDQASYSPARRSAYPAAWVWAAEMAHAGDGIATAPIDLAIARIRAVYRNWNRDTTVSQMRSDWDAAFGGCTAPVMCEPVAAGRVDGEWISPAHAPKDKAILYFHGGGFRIGSVASHRDLIAQIALASSCRVLAINYRLAPEHRFPAALDDALAAYDWMIGRELEPANIAFAGDSAGGNLVLAAMLALRERALPLPAVAVLMSPWTDLAATGASYVSRAESDPIHQRSMILALAKNYLGDHDPRDPLVSPLHADLRGLPPLMIQVGDRETVLDDSVMFADKARAAGVEIDLQVWDGMIHVFQMFGAELPEAHQAIASIAGFLNRHLRIKAERASHERQARRSAQSLRQ